MGIELQLHRGRIAAVRGTVRKATTVKKKRRMETKKCWFDRVLKVFLNSFSWTALLLSDNDSEFVSLKPYNWV